jgi:3-keto-5-aminohexanoate cleavage enzyme
MLNLRLSGTIILIEEQHYMPTEKKIVNFCPTGTQPTKDNSFAPIFHHEIIENVLSCYETGITMVHLHARDRSGANTYSRAVYQQIIEGIKKYAPELVIGVSLSGRYFSERSLRAEVLSLCPDLASLTVSSMNFPKSASVNDPDTIGWLLQEMDVYGVIPEVECFDTGMLNYTKYLVRKGLLKAPLYINVIFGNLFNADTGIANISAVLQNLPENAAVCFGGIGQAQLKANIMGLMEVDGVRIGLEDNLYFTERNLATNEQLLQRLQRIMNEMSLSVLSPQDFKQMGYANRKTGCTGA